MAGDLGTCKACGRTVRWVRTASGGWFPPLEPYPDPLGHVVLDDDGRTGGDGPPDMRVRYRRHFCNEYDQTR